MPTNAMKVISKNYGTDAQAGSEAWFTSSWQEGCTFQMPVGHVITDARPIASGTQTAANTDEKAPFLKEAVLPLLLSSWGR